MKDSIITAQRKRTELITLLVCFLIANVVNLCAIVAYSTRLVELVTQIGYVVLFSIALYLCWSVLRLIYYGIRKVVK